MSWFVHAALYSLIFILGAFLVNVFITRGRRSDLPMPPSPRSYPFIGHLLSMPKSFEHLGFAKLGKEIGSDIFSLSFFGTTIIVINSAQPAIDLFEKRSAIYSDRMCPPALGEASLMNWADFVSFVGYTELWKRYRRMMHTWMNKQAVPTFYPSQQHEVRLLLQRLLINSERLGLSEELDLELYRTVSSTVLRSVYGYNLQGLDDPFVLGVKESIDHIAKAATPSNFLVNACPALIYVPEWFPGARWKRTLQEWGRQKDMVTEGTFKWTKEQMAAGTNEPSMVASFLGNAKNWGQDEADANTCIREVGIALFGGGTDTTVNTVIVFILAMIMFPDVQAKAQEEIDVVIGTNRLPTINDQPSLPYVGRVILEALRWQPVTPLAIPHVCAQEDEYRGYRIPKGAVVFGNVWAISRDENVYKNPETFDPDRFLDPNVSPAPGFGWGRRMCPGIHYANSSLFITVVSILAAFNITMRKDDSGHYMVPTTEGAQNSLAYHPKPFKFKLAPRSDLHVELVQGGA